MIPEPILAYIKKINGEYLATCMFLARHLRARDVVQCSFKYHPSLTYLDLNWSQPFKQWHNVTTWEDWRMHVDKERKTIIYRLDLKDKYQSIRCSPFCLQDLSGLHWGLKYSKFPGYIRVHGVDKPEEYQFSLFQTLDQDIIEYLKNSDNKKLCIQICLKTIDRLKDWIGEDGTGSLYAFFLNTLFEMETLDCHLIDTLLNYSESLIRWIFLDLGDIKAALSTSKILQMFNSDIFSEEGSWSILVELLAQQDDSIYNMFCLYDLDSCHENYFIDDKHSKNFMELNYFASFSLFFGYWGIPRHLEDYMKLPEDDDYKHIDAIVLIALCNFQSEEGKELLKIAWRCTPIAFLTYQDFQNFFNPELPEEIESILNSVYIWFTGVVGTELKRSEPRDLKHYSRCALREKLNMLSKLPNGIETLQIPGSLKSYLRLEE